MTDQKIIEILRSNRPQKALVKLYSHAKMVKSFVKSNAGSTQDAEDIFQEALIILIRKARESDFVLTSSISTFLFGIARRLWLEQLRKRQRDFSLNANFDIGEDIERLIEKEKKFVLAERALAHISEQCLKMLKLFYIEKKSMSQIAVTLGFNSENSAKTAKYKCLEHARNQFISLTNKMQLP
jgi:RNA polymerase sigma factor (sigma-70 family)